MLKKPKDFTKNIETDRTIAVVNVRRGDFEGARKI